MFLMATEKKFTLREYQQKAATDGLDCFEKKKNGVLVCPTGSGKSLIIATIAGSREGKTIVLQPSKEILEQNARKMQAFGHKNIGIYSASCNRKYRGQVTFATIGSVIRKRGLFREFSQLIVDECHLVNSKGGMYEQFINDLQMPTIGLTATPYRMRSYNDSYGCGAYVAESRILTRTRPRIFNTIAHVTQVGELFEQGYLCPLDYDWQNDYDSRKIKSTSTGQGYDDDSLLAYNKSQHIPTRIAEVVARLDSEHILIFTQFRSESAEVIAALAKRDIVCVEVSAETKKDDRESIIRGFRLGRIRCVVNVGVLTTGFDFPELDAVILGRPTKSVGLYYQMTGRGIRPAPGKEFCRLIDLCDNVKRFGRIETFEIYDSNGNEMWRLRSNVGDLTGVDVNTGYDLEKTRR